MPPHDSDALGVVGGPAGKPALGRRLEGIKAP